jgi:hypothetical protein
MIAFTVTVTLLAFIICAVFTFFSYQSERDSRTGGDYGSVLGAVMAVICGMIAIGACVVVIGGIVALLIG